VARLTLWRIRYDPRDGTAGPDVAVTVRRGDGTAERLDVAGADLVPGVPVAFDHAGLDMEGPVTVEIAPAAGGRPVGGFEVAEVAASAATGDNWRAVSRGGVRYTVSYRVELEGRDVVDPVHFTPRICTAAVARNSESCLTPGERGVAMATRYNRMHLIYGADLMIEGIRVTDAHLRAAYQAAAGAGSALGPLHVDPATFPADAQLAAHGGNLVVSKRSDAATFQKGARALARYYDALWGPGAVSVHVIDNGLDATSSLGHRHPGDGDDLPLPARLAQVLAVLAGLAPDPPLSLVAFFCHGWRQGFQLGGNAGGHMTAAETRQLADAIQRVAREDVVVALYACDTAHLQNGFAADLRDALLGGAHPLPHCRVVGHTQVAHAYLTPDIRVFEGADGAGAPGWDIAPAGTAHARFRARLGRGSPWPAFRWSFPLMSREAIDAFLGDAEPPAEVFQMPPE